MSVLKKSINVEANFFLKQVDPVAVAKKYISGGLQLPKNKVKFENNVLTSDMKIGSSHEDEIYEIKDKNGESIRIITLDQKNWTKNEISSNRSAETFDCHWCRESCVGNYLVCPLKIEKTSNGHTSQLIVHGTGTFCCYECVYANFKTKHHHNVYMRNYLYSDTETLIRFLYNYQTGKSDLKATPDWTMRQKFGGPLSDKDYYSTKTSYVPIPNIIQYTAKTMYLNSK